MNAQEARKGRLYDHIQMPVNKPWFDLFLLVKDIICFCLKTNHGNIWFVPLLWQGSKILLY
jgi:hypothetical protein